MTDNQRVLVKTMIAEVNGHLHAVLVQAAPTDDQIIIQHVRDAAALSSGILRLMRA